MNISLAFAVLLVIRRLILDPASRKRFLSGITIPILIWLALSLILPYFSQFTFKPNNWANERVVVLCYVVALVLIDNVRLAVKSLWAIIISGGVMSLYAIFQYFYGYDVIRGIELEHMGNGHFALGLFSWHLTWGGVALVLVMISLARMFYSVKGKWGVTAIGLALLNGIGMITSFGRSAILGGGVGLLLLITLLRKKYRYYALGGAVIAVVLAVFFMPGLSDRLMKSVNVGQGITDDWNEGTRMRLWQTSLVMIQNHPVTGIGWGNFGVGFSIYKVPGYYHTECHSHSDILQEAAFGGIPTVIAYAAVWVLFLVLVVRAYRKTAVGDQERWILQMGMAVAVAFLVAGIFQCYLTDDEVGNMVWYTLGLTMAVVHLRKMGLSTGLTGEPCA